MGIESEVIWMDGQLVPFADAKVHVLSHTLHYGVGVFEGIRGMTQALVERYAADYRAFPHVLATGGDADTLYADSELVTRVVPDLVLRGILVAVRTAAEAE